MTGQRLSAHTGVSQFVPIQPLYGAKQGAQEGVLLINLGSPASPSVADVRSYLETFLMDERVISIAPFWRSLVVRRIIGSRRAPRSASNYAKIWDAESGTFPLVRSSARLAHELSIRLEKPVGLAMRYGKPEMDEALLALQGLGVQRIKLLPLYPHYTRSSFETAVVHALERAKALGVEAELEIVPPFYNDKLYRQVLAGSIRPYLEEPFDKLIISMHGIPMTHLSRPCQASNGDRHRCLEHQHSPQEQMTCYRLHCESTYTYLCQDLGLAPSKWSLSIRVGSACMSGSSPIFPAGSRHGLKRAPSASSSYALVSYAIASRHWRRSTLITGIASWPRGGRASPTSPV